MPELPEVESVRLELVRHLPGQQLQQIRFSGKSCLLSQDSLEPEVLQGKVIENIVRKGKYLLWDWGDMQLLCHLGMSGMFLWNPQDSNSHDHFIFEFQNGQLVYRDPRRFGYFRIAPAGVSLERWDSLGPDALDAKLRYRAFFQRLQRSSRPIKDVIMDQKIIAGVGNIYASEALFLARIHPQKSADFLSISESQCLLQKIRGVLRKSLRMRGTTFSDYRLTNGRAGGMQRFLQVFQKQGERCPECGNTIQKVIQSQRSTFFCPNCQR